MTQARPYLLMMACAAMAAGVAVLTVGAYDAYGASILLTYAENGLSNCF